MAPNEVNDDKDASFLVMVRLSTAKAIPSAHPAKSVMFLAPVCDWKAAFIASNEVVVQRSRGPIVPCAYMD